MDQVSTIKKTSIEGLLLIQRQAISDDRGFFKEVARLSEINESLGTQFNIAQINHSHSEKNVLRGIHMAPWNKLIYVSFGKVQCAIVDLRPDSPTFLRFESFILGEDNNNALFVSKFLGNSYAVLSDKADYFYFTDQEWEAGKEKSIVWNDPMINIPWQVTDPILSQRDQSNITVKDLFPEKF